MRAQTSDLMSAVFACISARPPAQGTLQAAVSLRDDTEVTLKRKLVFGKAVPCDQLRCMHCVDRQLRGQVCSAAGDTCGEFAHVHIDLREALALSIYMQRGV